MFKQGGAILCLGVAIIIIVEALGKVTLNDWDGIFSVIGGVMAVRGLYKINRWGTR